MERPIRVDGPVGRKIKTFAKWESAYGYALKEASISKIGSQWTVSSSWFSMTLERIEGHRIICRMWRKE